MEAASLVQIQFQTVLLVYLAHLLPHVQRRAQHAFRLISCLLIQSRKVKFAVHVQLMDVKGVRSPQHPQLQSFVYSVKWVSLYLMVHVIHALLISK